MADLVPIRRALVSVTDKTDLLLLAGALRAAGAEIVSTGGSARMLRDAGFAVRDVAALSGFPEILGGRVKTLVPKVHGGILGVIEDASHAADMAAHGIEPIDLVAVNLYAFEAALLAGADEAAAIEAIDIGGPALLRAAAKNHARVTVLSDPAQYPAVITAMAADGGTRLALRRRLAGEAHARTAAYDAAIASWYSDETIPERMLLAGTLRLRLRYGENPHQEAGFYARPDAVPPDLACAEQVQGKALSYNNLADTDAALSCIAEFDEPAVAIIKHGNPCGVATGTTVQQAWTRALAADPVSAFGGIVACNRVLDAAAATAIAEIFTEVVVAPGATEPARAALAGRPGLRLLLTGGGAHRPPAIRLRTISGGFLVQTADAATIDTATLRVVSARRPTADQLADLCFAMRVCKHAMSNAIVLARDRATIGVGAGQTSRVDAARLAAGKAAWLGHAPGRGCVAASDAFFPFADGLRVVIEAGATAVVAPGGSVRDAEIVAAADAAGVALAFVGTRHFRH